MKRLLLASLLTACATAFAQNAPLEGVSETTDPAKIRDVERRAEEIKSRQQTSGSSSSATDSASSRSRGDMRRGERAQRRDMRRDHEPMRRDRGEGPRTPPSR